MLKNAIIAAVAALGLCGSVNAAPPEKSITADIREGRKEYHWQTYTIQKDWRGHEKHCYHDHYYRIDPPQQTKPTKPVVRPSFSFQIFLGH